MPKYNLESKDDIASLAHELEQLQDGQERLIVGGPSATKKRRGIRALLMPALVGLACLILLGAISLLVWRFLPAAHVAKRAVPDVRTKQIAQAQAAVIQAGLRAVIQYDKTSPKPAGTVVGVAPSPGTMVELGGNVILTVAGDGSAAKNATGSAVSQPLLPTPTPAPTPTPLVTPSAQPPVAHPPTVATATTKIAVPDVVDVMDTKAAKMLQDVGLKPVVTAGKDLSRPDRIVLECDPKVGTALEPGSLVHLTVNALAVTDSGTTPRTPAAPVTMRNYAGMPWRDAVKDLTGLGLKPLVTYEASRLQVQGNVVRTAPAFGTAVAAGSEVTLVVAK